MRVTLSGINHDYGGRAVLKDVHLSVLPGDRIGIVGPNGSGKTTLVRILTGLLAPVSGAVSAEPGTRTGYVPQHLELRDETTVRQLLLDEVLDMRGRLRRLEEAMSEADPSDDAGLASLLAEYQSAREPYDAADGDGAEDRAARLLDELGLPGGLDQEIRTLSGGERNVLTLARALMGQPNLLILDEPGNHLDFAGLAWLEAFLERFDGAVVVVSHNRYLLDKVATSIWEIFAGEVSRHAGNYSDFRFNRLTQAISDQATWSVQQKAIARLEKLVEVFEQRARTTGDPAWGKRLRARRSQLEKARDLALGKPEIDEKKIVVQFARGATKSDIAVEVKGYSKAFGDRALFSDARLLVHAGERVGIVGPNGCGKTTFLADLVTNGNWEDPVMRIGPSMKTGYCAQQRDRFADDLPVLDAMLTVGDFTRNEVFAALSRLLFGWGDLERPVSSLSGGEWNRLQLAMAIIGKANLLILDEPTNHLDIASREAVEDALSDFEGTIIAVSHDRYFLDAAVKRIVEITDRGFRSHAGTFTEFWFAHSGARPVKEASLGRRGRQVDGARKAARGDATRDDEARAKSREDAKIERDLLELEARRLQLEALMTEAFETGSHRDGRRHAADLEKVRARIEELYGRWGGN